MRPWWGPLDPHPSPDPPAPRVPSACPDSGGDCPGHLTLAGQGLSHSCWEETARGGGPRSSSRARAARSLEGGALSLCLSLWASKSARSFSQLSRLFHLLDPRSLTWSGRARKRTGSPPLSLCRGFRWERGHRDGLRLWAGVTLTRPSLTGLLLTRTWDSVWQEACGQRWPRTFWKVGSSKKSAQAAALVEVCSRQEAPEAEWLAQGDLGPIWSTQPHPGQTPAILPSSHSAWTFLQDLEDS
ncbi:uncharacterized protein LOC115273407 [Suricata suricatta]|uniref:uncharacterized protein LOC115273407 n=1 Tax=Suricata suricatta TaxID=37032 RepID=UPI001155A808|nr:uncharacterized protein LOC115273407 [Suricata suricatta]